MNVIWTKSKLHKIFSKETLQNHAQASGDGCSSESHCCRLCGGDNNLRPFGDTYVWEGVEARYDQLLYDCFGIKVFPLDCMICEWCVKQLKNTERFRALVHAAFEQTPSEGSSKRSVEIKPVEQKIQFKATPSVINSRKKIMELSKTKITAEEMRRKRTLQRKKEIKKGMTACKRVNITCSKCHQRYPMMMPLGGDEQFVCSRCKKDGERSAVCKKCSVVMPMSMMRDHLALHVKAVLRGKSRLRAQQNKLSQDKIESAVETYMISKHRCNQCSKQFNDEKNLLRHLKMSHRGGLTSACAICGEEFKSKQRLDSHVAEHSKPTIFKCKHCAAYFKSKRTLQTHLSVHQNIMSKVWR